jgi:hypothetical protein
MRVFLISILTLLSIQAFSQKSGIIRLIEFNLSSCDEESDPYRLRTRIVRKELTRNYLTLEIATTDTCCISVRPIVNFSDNTIYLDERNMGEECECICCYQFVYKLKGKFNNQTKIKFRGKDIEESREKYKTYPIKFDVLNGDTVNLVDKYGLRQGQWFSESKKPEAWTFYDFVDDINVRATKLYPDGSIKRYSTKEKVKIVREGTESMEYFDWNHYVEYFEGGKIKSECISKNNRESYREGTCKEWNEKGELVYDGPYKEN